jgi:hypothetical protein
MADLDGSLSQIDVPSSTRGSLCNKVADCLGVPIAAKTPAK